MILRCCSNKHQLNTPISILPQTGSCPEGELEYRHRGDLLCYHLTPKLPFSKSLAACRATGGRLATIYSQEHNDLLYSMLTESAFIGAVARGHMLRHPLGDSGPGVIWSWTSGERPDYTNVLPIETRGFYKQPDGTGFEGCMELMLHSILENDPGNSFWGDTDCRAPKPGICVRRKDFVQLPNVHKKHGYELGLRRGRRASCSEGFSRVAVKRFGDIQGSRSTCLSERQTADNFTTATEQCRLLNPTATIARPSILAGRRRWKSAHGAGKKALVWAGADRRNAALQWRWQEDSRDVTRHAWAAGEPQDTVGADCAAYDPTRRGMVATNCEEELEFVCETLPHGCATEYHVSASGLECVRNVQKGCKGTEDYTGKPTEKACTAKLCPISCPSGYTQFGLKCLMVSDTTSWSSDIEEMCQARKMRIMRPLNPLENEFLRRQTERLGCPLWILADSTNSTQKRPFSFSRWHRYASYGLPREPNEPATKGEPTWCAIIWYDGDWMDVDCFGEFPAVCERPISWAECAKGIEMLKAM